MRRALPIFAAAANRRAAAIPRVNHLALFQFKPDCTADDIDLVRRTIADLPKAIPGIVAFNWSPDVSTEGLTD